MIELDEGICAKDFLPKYAESELLGKPRRRENSEYPMIQVKCGVSGCTRTCWLWEKVEDGVVVEVTERDFEGTNCVREFKWRE